MRKARLDDVEKIMDIITKVKNEMKNEGNEQWDDTYPTKDVFIRDIQEDSLYVDEDNNDIRGVICLNEIEAEEYKDLSWSSNEKSLVIHRMAVNSNYRNKGVGTELLEFAQEQALKLKIDSVKTDTYSKNIKMNGLFKKFGFIKVGEVSFSGKDEKFNCYEKLGK